MKKPHKIRKIEEIFRTALTCPNVKNSKIYVDLRLHEIQFSDLPQIINALSVLLHQLVSDQMRLIEQNCT